MRKKKYIKFISAVINSDFLIEIHTRMLANIIHTMETKRMPKTKLKKKN